jgi:hypothetical protein
MKAFYVLNQKTSQMSKFAKFQYCYIYFLANIAFGIAYIIATYILRIDKLDFLFMQIVGNSLGGFVSLIISLYIYLGYIKYSHNVNSDKLHNVFSIIIVMAITGFILMNTPYPVDWLYKKYKLVPIITSFLLFYVFKTIDTEEKTYFQRLSLVYLAQFILQVVMASIKLIVGSMSVFFVFYFIQAGVSLLTIYLEATLFRQLYHKYEKGQLVV